MAKKLSKKQLSKAGRILQNPHSREKKETQAAKILAKVRWAKNNLTS